MKIKHQPGEIDVLGAKPVSAPLLESTNAT
jgi:hypothetical protein